MFQDECNIVLMKTLFVKTIFSLVRLKERQVNFSYDYVRYQREIIRKLVVIQSSNEKQRFNKSNYKINNNNNNNKQFR